MEATGSTSRGQKLVLLEFIECLGALKLELGISDEQRDGGK